MGEMDKLRKESCIDSMQLNWEPATMENDKTEIEFNEEINNEKNVLSFKNQLEIVSNHSEPNLRSDPIMKKDSFKRRNRLLKLENFELNDSINDGGDGDEYQCIKVEDRKEWNNPELLEDPENSLKEENDDDSMPMIDENTDPRSPFDQNLNDVNLKCDKCSYTTTRNFHLERHAKEVHEKIQNYACEECGVTFSRKDSLRRHAKNKHNNGI